MVASHLISPFLLQGKERYSSSVNIGRQNPNTTGTSNYPVAGKSSATMKMSRCPLATVAISVFFAFCILLFSFNKQSIDATLPLHSNLYFSSQTPTLSPHLTASPEPTSGVVADEDPESQETTGSPPNASSPEPTVEVIAADPESPTLSRSPPNASSPTLSRSPPDDTSTEPTFKVTVGDQESARATGSPSNSSSPSIFRKGHQSGSVVSGNLEKSCDLYVGTWVRDERAGGDYPIYRPGSCPYVDEAFDCQVNGRKDSDYLKWRWKPDGCDLPRFNATDFLERLRGKRLTVVGDSMNRNQFESLLCILREGLTNKSRMYEVDGYKISKDRGFFTFKLEDYDCTIDFVRSHFLVKEGRVKGSSNRTLAIDKMDRSAEKWKLADILVFNTGHWWTPVKTSRGENYYKERGYLYPKVEFGEAFRKALKTWANWIDKNIDPSKKLVFYRGLSSTHFRGGDWDSGGKCDGETGPILNGNFLNRYPLIMKIAEEVIQEMKVVPVVLLNVTRLTNFRRDGHPSYYGKNNASDIPGRPRDCSHWCLPGVPDAWNELIYATLVFRQTSSNF